ncbi:hypothetical protein [Krasilnikovia sp. MM14-A1004]|uniref:hypothetical protein n=1 Tax=Krasilnikovia sp. MM14-A1004 TaxID=3373541 RepID=UPI00399CC216
MAACSSGDATYGGAFGWVSDLADNGVGGVLRTIAYAIVNAGIQMMQKINDVPTLGPKGEENAGRITDQIKWLVVAIAVASLLFAAARMALERKGEAGTTALKGIVRMILVAGASTYVVTNLGTLSDRYTGHLFKISIDQLTFVMSRCGNVDLATFLLIVVGLLLILSALVQIVMLYLRLGVMVMLFGTLPLAAASSMTQWGGGWWRKHIAWMVAWLVYKPAVALVLYGAVVMISTDGGADAAQQKIAGCGLLLLSTVAMPALLRLIVPAASALGSGDGMAAAVGAGGAAAGAAAAMAGKGAGFAQGFAGAARGAATGAASAGGSGGGGSGGGGGGGGGGAGRTGQSGGGSGGSSPGAGMRGLGAVAGAAGMAAGAVRVAAQGTQAAATGATRAYSSLSSLGNSAAPGIHDDDGGGNQR